MRYPILFILISLLGCSDISKNQAFNPVGKWKEIVPEGMCDDCGGIMDFSADGTFKYEGRYSPENLTFHSYGKWKFIDSEMCIFPQGRNFFSMNTGKKIENYEWPLDSYCNPYIEFDNNQIIFDGGLDSYSKMIRLN
ncbi:hypothetical protein [Agaribacterium haliotis]|uniref:hypothetical protein n=1 Tax=Agaribacterium haliotis TaxID=2013869 RepID=UPI000BB5915E|nr:hypothetical protein [Agaribacterium haliotis]